MGMKGKKPTLGRTLLIIPVVAMMDVVLFAAGVMLDQKMANPDSAGHPAPALTMIFTAVSAVVTVIAVIIVLVRLIRILFRK